MAPPDADPDAWSVQSYQFGSCELLLARPRDPDQLLDDPAVQAASRSCDYMPYWAYLWPGAILLARHILSQQRAAGTRAIEIGCGLGLAGLAALASGMHVTFSDYSPAALALAQYNARLNGFDRFDACLIDWKKPPERQFQLVLGADVLYEPRCLNDVLGALDSVLGADGQAWLSDPHRSVADEFPQRARDRSYCVNSVPIQAAVASGRPVQGRIFCVTRDYRRE